MNSLKIRIPIKDGYEIRSMTQEEFDPFYKKFAEPIWQKEVIYQLDAALDSQEKAKICTLQQRMGEPFRLNLAVFKGSEFVGWTWGRQESASSFYMVTSGILPQHRRCGLYGCLLKEVLKITSQLGFQTIYSRHSPDNNEILIAKLKAGFVITSFEVSDLVGIVVHLTFFTNPTRKKWFAGRVGHLI